MEPIKCYFLEPMNREQLWLRRYIRALDASSKCTTLVGCHDAQIYIGDGPLTDRIGDDHPHTDERWPKKCSECDYVFQDEDHWQLFRRTIYVRADTGTEMTLNGALPGAMWYADWMPEEWKGSDGHCLVVKTPKGDWLIDSRASNCTLPEDRIHKCWCRHGTPPNVTVDKNGNTCEAGGGSIQQQDFHGFLQNGFLVQV